MKENWDLKTFRESFRLIHNRISSKQNRLNELDAAIGDGDHGTTVCRGFREMAAAVKDEAFDDIGSLFYQGATAFIENTGGAIGPILGAFFAQGAQVFDGAIKAGPAKWATFLINGTEAVKAVGEANVGDKTLLDALLPAVAAFTAEAKKESDLRLCFEAAANAALNGAVFTEKMMARRGRARFLGARSLGHRDAGAETVYLIFETWHLYELEELRLPDKENNSGNILLPPQNQSGKFINCPGHIIADELKGFAAAYPRHIRVDHRGSITRAMPKEKGKTAICIGHGGGHTPSMGGFVGTGLLDAAIVGNLFTCAAGTRIATAIKQADRGGGVVLLISNHEGDVLNARLALGILENTEHNVVPILHYDDISTASPEERSKRRGLGGLLFAVAIGGAAAEAGLPIDDVVCLLEKTRDNTVTLSAAATPPNHPATGEPLFNLKPGEMEVGIGVHGEAGSYRGPLLPADETIGFMVSRLLSDLSFQPGDETLVFLNGTGGISLTELHILYGSLDKILRHKRIKVYDTVIGEYFTTFDMGGFSLSLCKIDTNLKNWWNRPSHGVYFRKKQF